MFGTSDLKGPPSPKLQHQNSDTALNTFPKVPSGGTLNEDSLEFSMAEENTPPILLSTIEDRLKPSK